MRKDFVQQREPKLIRGIWVFLRVRQRISAVSGFRPDFGVRAECGKKVLAADHVRPDLDKLRGSVWCFCRMSVNYKYNVSGQIFGSRDCQVFGEISANVWPDLY